jgi:arginine/ornithine transport system substrate-binding protein
MSHDVRKSIKHLDMGGSVMWRLITLAVSALVWLSVGAAFPDESSAQDKIRIAIDNAYPPFSSLDSNGKPMGFEVELIEGFCTHMKAECELMPHPWDGTMPALLAGKFDAIVNSVSITDERKKTVDFTRPYYSTGAAFIGKKGTKVEFTPGGLKGKTIGAQASTIHTNYLTDNWKGIVTIREYPDDNSMKLDLLAGRIDLAMGDDLILLDFLKKPEAKDLQFVGPRLTDPKWFGVGVGVVVKKGNAELQKKFDDAIVASYEDGTFARLNQKYFPEVDISARHLW